MKSNDTFTVIKIYKLVITFLVIYIDEEIIKICSDKAFETLNHDKSDVKVV